MPRIAYGMVRSLPWRLVLASSVLAVVTTAYVAFQGHPSEASIVNGARVAAVIVSFAMPYAVEDAAHRLTAPLSFDLFRQRLVRLGLITLWTGAITLLIGTIALAGLLNTPSLLPGVPSRAAQRATGTSLALGVEVWALAMLGAACAAVAFRVRRNASPGAAANVVMIVLVALALRLPPRWELFADRDSLFWSAAHARWAGIGAVSIVVFTAVSHVGHSFSRPHGLVWNRGKGRRRS